MGTVLDAGDTELWDTFNADLVRVAGTEANLYSLQPQLNRDPLYDEATAFDYVEYKCMIVVRQPERTIDVSERGKERLQETPVWFSRALLEDMKCAMPKEGDVIEFWGGQYDLEDIKDESLVPVSPVGGPGAWSIQFAMNAKRRERFLPERKTGTAPLPPSTDTL